MAEEIKTTVIFVCGLNPHPVTKLDDVHSVRIGKMFVPAIHGKARLPDNVREYEVDFPITIADADTTEKFESLRKAFHERLDQSFDGYTKKWQEAASLIEQREKKAPRTITEALKEVKEKQDAEQGEKVGDTDSVDIGS